MADSLRFVGVRRCNYQGKLLKTARWHVISHIHGRVSEATLCGFRYYGRPHLATADTAGIPPELLCPSCQWRQVSLILNPPKEDSDDA